MWGYVFFFPTSAAPQKPAHGRERTEFAVFWGWDCCITVRCSTIQPPRLLRLYISWSSLHEGVPGFLLELVSLVYFLRGSRRLVLWSSLFQLILHRNQTGFTSLISCFSSEMFPESPFDASRYIIWHSQQHRTHGHLRYPSFGQLTSGEFPSFGRHSWVY